MPAGYELKQKREAWIKAGCLASEMESATLFIVAQVLRARAGCVLSTVWNQERARQGLSNPECHDPERAIRAAVEAVRLQQDEADAAWQAAYGKMGDGERMRGVVYE